MQLAAAALAALAIAPNAGAPAATGPTDRPEPARIAFGHSAEGRDLVAGRVGPDGGPRTVLVVGEVHGNEEAGRAVVRSLRRDSGGPGA